MMNSIQHFFSEIKCHFQCYNMGRLIQAVDQQSFIDFEQNQSPWHSPFLQYAWLAIVFWQDATPKDHSVWFLKLPLDELAKLNLLARDDFLRTLLSALDKPKGSAAKVLHSLEAALKDSPYGFQPKDEQMANFHAIVHKQFSLPASQYYQPTQEYLTDKRFFSQWSQLGIQGIADFSARLDEHYIDSNKQKKSNEQLLIDSLPYLPPEVFSVFAHSLENHPSSPPLTQAIYQVLINTLEQKTLNPQLIIVSISSIRSTAQAQDKTLQAQLIHRLLSSAIANDVELLATIAGRCWLLLTNKALLSLFLEALADTQSLITKQTIQQQTAFNTIIADLMFIPNMRQNILELFRSEQRSEQLTRAIGSFFQQNFQKQSPQ